MKTNYLLLCLTLLSFSVTAQRTTQKTVSYTTDSLFFDQDWMQTLLLEDSKYARVIRRTPDGKPYGTVRDYYYPSWQKQWEGKLLRENPDVPQGFCTFWYPNGQVQSSATFINGEAQADLQQWHEDGTPVTCTYKYTEVLPLTKAKLHSYYHSGSSRTVIPVSLPADAMGIVYRIDIRDEGAPPVGWSTVSALATASVSGGVSAMLLSGAEAMAAASEDSGVPTVNTKCHFYVTTSLEDAEYFVRSKGGMPVKNACLWRSSNITQETRPLAVPEGIQTVYFCINNDNLQTSAEATLNVNVLQTQCQ